MRLRLTPVLLLACLSACSPQPGRLRITVVFENETQTQCIRPTARSGGGVSIQAEPALIRRPMGVDTLLIGLGENADLQGEVSVTINRYPTADCSGDFDSETKTVTIVRGGPVAMLEFRYRGTGGADGGTDGGTDAGTDGGVDAGCNLGACPNAPGSCEGLPAIGCAANGTCRYTITVNAPCGDAGACNAGGTCAAACSVLGSGAACDDGLSCTPTSTCLNGVCTGTCPPAPQCNDIAQPLACSSTDSTACALVPTPDEGSCSTPQFSRCLSGACQPWLTFPSRNFDGGITSITYPTTGWSLGDGGACDTVISTSGPAATVLDGGCGTPNITSVVDADGNSVISMTDLTVAQNARIHFVGTRPARLIILGDATVRGLISVSPTVPGLAPAGSNPASCTTAQSGDAAGEGGGGGGFGGEGGLGGNSGGSGGTPNSSANLPLRGGCSGGNGFRNSGNSAGGVGGGAIQLLVRGALTVTGTIAASGAGGTAGTDNTQGGGGGGSGGMVLLEADSITLASGAVTANGGGGGEGGDSGQTSEDGAMGPLSTANRAAGGNAGASQAGNGGGGGAGMNAGGEAGGNDGSRGGGGGGGGIGVVFLSARNNACTKGSGVISGFQPTTQVCP